MLSPFRDPLTPQAKLAVQFWAQIAFYFGLLVAGIVTGHFGPTRLMPMLIPMVSLVSGARNLPAFYLAPVRVLIPVLFCLLLFATLIELDSRYVMTAIDHILNAVAITTCLAILYTTVKIGNLIASEKSQLQQPTP